ncbi:glycosyl hydrolase family 76 protein [Trichodelitschia bisporula]|uniref:Mannan endo-1,6-alpha-mannosidase n=1 Tax=Trichodelitschia bisporula TaxID=703511 RepID=A0A6G1HSP3_9PEZI|nr:glycosyl hydrolase family 76 protein [Trichodelitschia bisporula]
MKLLRALLVVQSLHHVSALTLDVGSTASIKKAAKALADSAMRYYDGDKPGSTPGLLPAAGEFNWWEAGALFGQMVEYWYYTGDSTYNDMTKQALVFQAGPSANYEPENQTRTEGNDDQAFWAFAAMSAAEFNFPNPDPKEPQYLALAQAVFNRQASRWDDKHCGGGLRWQFNPLNNGWMEKNAISNGCFFQLAARLARYTKNATYAQWADKTYNWIAHSPLMSPQYDIYDNIPFTETGCDGPIGQIQWTYNVGSLIAGAAYMYNHTNGSPAWKERLSGLLNSTGRVFFPQQYGGQILVEYACEPRENCNKDQRSFKGYLARWLAVAAQMAPYTRDRIMPWLQKSAQAAANVCTGDPSNVVCGRKWYEAKDDGTRDIGNQMTALSIVQSNLILNVRPPSDVHSGSSTGDPGAGNGGLTKPTDWEATRVMMKADKAGAWILTVFLLAAAGGWGWFLVSEGDEFEKGGFARQYEGSRWHVGVGHRY